MNVNFPLCMCPIGHRPESIGGKKKHSNISKVAQHLSHNSAHKHNSVDNIVRLCPVRQQQQWQRQRNTGEKCKKYPSDKTETSKFGYYYQGNQYRLSNNGCVHSATYALNWFDSSCFHPSDATLHDVSVQCGLQITNDPIRLFFSG